MLLAMPSIRKRVGEAARAEDDTRKRMKGGAANLMGLEGRITIDLTLDDLDNTSTQAKVHAQPLTANSSIEILEFLPLAPAKPRSKKRARTPPLQDSKPTSPSKRQKTGKDQAAGPSTVSVKGCMTGQSQSF